MNKLGLLKRREWSRCPSESSWQVRGSRLCQKGKEERRQSRVPNREWGESHGERELHLNERERERSEREHEEKRVSSTAKEGRFQGEEGEQARRAYLWDVQGSMSG